jgi:hypothetical protein
MPRSRGIEAYAILSEDGMLANAAGIMPDSLKFAADRRLIESGLDGVDVVVHGRHSHERQLHSYLRRRLILTRQVPGFAALDATLPLDERIEGLGIRLVHGRARHDAAPFATGSAYRPWPGQRCTE